MPTLTLTCKKKDSYEIDIVNIIIKKKQKKQKLTFLFSLSFTIGNLHVVVSLL